MFKGAFRAISRPCVSQRRYVLIALDFPMLLIDRRLLALCIVVLCTACSPRVSDESAPAAEAAQTVAQEPAAEAEQAPQAVAQEPAAERTQGALRLPEVRLLEPGEEPRQPLRFVWGEDEPRRVITEIRIQQTVVADGEEQPPVPNAPIRSVMQLDPAPEEDAPGRFRYRLVGIEIVETEDVHPAMLNLLQSSLENMPAIQGTLILNDRGMITHLHQDRQAQQDAGMPMVQDDLLRELAGIPLPEEPVGPGARWVATSEVEAHGVRVEQEVTYLLGAVRDGVWEITWAIAQQALDQQIEIPDVPPGGPRVMLERLTAAGTGTAEVTPQRAAVPQVQTVALEMHVRADNAQPGAITHMITRQEASRRVAVEPVPAEGEAGGVEGVVGE